MIDILLDFLLSIIDLLRIALITSIPCFVVVIAAEQLHSKLSKRFSLSWAKSAFISTYLAVTLLIIFLYALPIYLAMGETSSSESIPAIFETSLFETLLFAVLVFLRLLLVGLAFSVMLLPFLFFAVWVFEWLKGNERAKKLPIIGQKFLATFVSALLAWIILLFVFPWAFGGLVYLLFWG